MVSGEAQPMVSDEAQPMVSGEAQPMVSHGITSSAFDSPFST
jgi:hypothetical protein